MIYYCFFSNKKTPANVHRASRSFLENITFMDMAPMALIKLFTSFATASNPGTASLYHLFHDMSFRIPLHAMEKARSLRTLRP